MKYLDNTGLNHLWSKIKAIFALKKIQTVSLTTSGWTLSNGVYTKSVSVSGVSVNSIVIVAPSPTSSENYGDCGIQCTGQGSGTLTFTALITPTSSLTVNVVNLGDE